MSADLEARLRAAMQAEVGQLPVLLTADAVADRIDRSSRRWRARLALALATLTLGLASVAALLVASGFLQAERDQRGGLPVDATPTGEATIPPPPTPGAASSPRVRPSPAPSPVPTPAVTPPRSTPTPIGPPPADAMPCGEAAVNLIDRQATVTECVTWWPATRYPLWQFPEDHKIWVANPDGDQHVIDAVWRVPAPSFCPDTSITLELVSLSEAGTPALLAASHVIESDCEVAELQRRAVRLTLRQPIAAEHVIFLQGKELRYYDEDHADLTEAAFHEPALGLKGRLTLSLFAGRASYAAGEPIELEAVLRYQRDADGPRGNVTFFGAVPKYGFIYEQLDGDTVIWDGQIADCEAVEMEPIDEVRVTDTVDLPPGRWRVSVTGDFSPIGCDGERFRFNPYVIVTVE